jgi:serine/threonine protein kinase
VAQSQAEHTGSSGPPGRAESRLPAAFGRYLLLQRLSRGGMGEIFLAKHGLAGFEKLAVIKKVLPHLAEDSQFISRFVDEAQVAIKLAHVNIAQVFEVGRVGDEYFLALEYVEGRDLRRTLSLLAQEKRRFPIDIALLVGREIANGLAYAHRRTAADGSSLGLVHCDISPPNVMVSFEGETKIIDFGIARSALRGTATDPKMGFGKFGYMAPEQLLRGGVVDHRTDVYSAGVVLFELLTGRRLYEPKDFTDYRALAQAVSQGQHRVPSDLDPALAPCDALITSTLAPRPEDRFSSAADLRDSIQRLLASINPTASTDQLSAVMRGLFAKEMAQQSELQERIANTHLADFHAQLHTQAVPTISFALIDPSLDSSRAPPRRPPRRNVEDAQRQSSSLSAERPARRNPSTILPSREAAPPAASVDYGVPPSRSPLDESAASTLHLLEARASSSSRRSMFVVAAAVAVIVGALVFVVIRNQVHRLAPAKMIPVVQPIDDVEVATPTPVAPLPPMVAAPGDVETERKPDRAAERKRRAERPEREITREAVTSQFEAVIKEYNAFKARYGMRLEVQWSDLATFMQFKLRTDNLHDAARKIEAFRGQMRMDPHK